jgi:hypothetical protein
MMHANQSPAGSGGSLTDQVVLTKGIEYKLPPSLQVPEENLKAS